MKQLQEMHDVEQAITPPAVDTRSPAIRLLENALAAPDVPAERIDKALEWMERLEKKAAIEEFNKSFAAIQAGMPTIQRSGKGHQNNKYATLEDIISGTKPILTAHGFGLHWTCEVDLEHKTLLVSACLRHAGGHSITNAGVYPFETSGSKSAIQSIGSAQTYAQRYTACALLGLATGDVEDDGFVGGATLSDDQIEEMGILLDQTKSDVPAFLKYAKVRHLSDIPADKFETLKAMILRKPQGG